MTHELMLALLGLGSGMIYAVLAQSVVLIYKGSGILNFSQGALAMVSAYAYFELRQNDVGFALAALAAVAISAVTGAAIHLLVIRQLKRVAPLVKIIATLAILTILQSIATLRYRNRPVFVDSFLPQGRFKAANVVFTIDRFWLAGAALLITAGLSLVMHRTLIGLATRAVVENEGAAAALGWSPHTVALFTWTLGGALAGVAGILIAPLIVLTPVTLTMLVVPAFAAALIGSFESFWLTLVGGLLLGAAESLITSHYPSVQGVSTAVPILVIVIVLVLRGKALPLRGHQNERLPAVGAGRVRPLLVLIAAVVSLVAVLGSPDDWVLAITTTAATAIVILSVVVVTGFAGQLSLAQYGLAGVGALIAGRLVANSRWPFEAAIVVGVLATALLGMAFAIPALRVRGVNLAILTLGLGVVLSELVFKDGSLTGGAEGLQVGPQTFLGVDINTVTHPGRYAILTLACLGFSAFVVTNIRRGRSGRRLLAVRTNERAAASLGVNVAEAKSFAFVVSAGVAGLGGILLAFERSSVLAQQFTPILSTSIVVLAIVGGLGYTSGSVIGALLAPGAIFALIGSKYLDNFTDWLALASGINVLALLFHDPNGLASKFSSFGKRIARPRSAPSDHAFLAERGDTRRETRSATLDIRSLTVRFGGVVALSNVDLVVRPGEIVGLIGPNGAGKTTLIDAVSGFVTPATGVVQLGSVDLTKMAAYRRNREGLSRSFQSVELFDGLTVQDNLSVASDRGDRTCYVTDLIHPVDRGLNANAVAAIKDFELTGQMGRRPAELSYGQRQLVGIARAVSTMPSVVLLDEPASGLSENEVTELDRLLKEMAGEGLGILLVEHNVPFVMNVCNRIAVLNFGVKIAEGTPSEIRSDPAVVAAYLGEDNAAQPFPEIHNNDIVDLRSS